MSAGQPERLVYLRSKIGDCQRCTLAAERQKIVFGDGDSTSGFVLVGEAPGAEEDNQGFPFVGASGALLNTWLEVAGLTRAGVYITNVVMCRPPYNRTPFDPEISACSPYLQAHLHILDPKVLVLVGKTAANVLLAPVEEYRSLGEWVHLCETKGPRGYPLPVSKRIVPTYVIPHPSAELRAEVRGPLTGQATALLFAARQHVEEFHTRKA